MRAGSLRFRVSVELLSGSKGAHGHTEEVWTQIAERRAAIDPVNGKETISAGAENSEATTKIRLRYESVLADLSTKHRIVHGTTVYDIVSPPINVGMRNREFILMCKVIN